MTIIGPKTLLCRGLIKAPYKGSFLPSFVQKFPFCSKIPDDINALEDIKKMLL